MRMNNAPAGIGIDGNGVRQHCQIESRPIVSVGDVGMIEAIELKRFSGPNAFGRTLA
jgi:hypothetical protein